jgi:hypothetical protein
MLFREAMGVFWQTLKDTWEELFMIAIVNLVWLFSWGAPLGLGFASQVPALALIGAVIAILVFPVTSVGVYYCTDRVAKGKTFNFSDFREGIALYWWKSILWLLANLMIIGLIILNLWFYSVNFQGTWVVIVGGLWIAMLALWVTIQVYFWPMMFQQEEPKLLMALKNAAFLLLANPFYAFFMLSFAGVFLVLSVGLTLPLIFVGMGIQGLLGCNAVVRLLISFGKIEDPRPQPVGR